MLPESTAKFRTNGIRGIKVRTFTLCGNFGSGELQLLNKANQYPGCAIFRTNLIQMAHPNIYFEQCFPMNLGIMKFLPSTACVCDCAEKTSCNERTAIHGRSRESDLVGPLTRGNAPRISPWTASIERSPLHRNQLTGFQATLIPICESLVYTARSASRSE